MSIATHCKFIDFSIPCEKNQMSCRMKNLTRSKRFYNRKHFWHEQIAFIRRNLFSVATFFRVESQSPKIVKSAKNFPDCLKIHFKWLLIVFADEKSNVSTESLENLKSEAIDHHFLSHDEMQIYLLMFKLQSVWSETLCKFLSWKTCFVYFGRFKSKISNEKWWINSYWFPRCERLVASSLWWIRVRLGDLCPMPNARRNISPSRANSSSLPVGFARFKASNGSPNMKRCASFKTRRPFDVVELGIGATFSWSKKPSHLTTSPLMFSAVFLIWSFFDSILISSVFKSWISLIFASFKDSRITELTCSVVTDDDSTLGVLSVTSRSLMTWKCNRTNGAMPRWTGRDLLVQVGQV